MPLHTAAFESLLIALSCSLDAFTASFAYGTDRISIPLLSNLVVSLVCSTVLGLSLLTGSFIRTLLPAHMTLGIAFTLLFVSGLVKLLDSATKTIIRKHNRQSRNNLSREIQFSMFNFSFILYLYANPEKADVNENKIISPYEAALLAASLSIDGIAVGFGAALAVINIKALITASVIANIVAVSLGSRLGNLLTVRVPFNMSWLSGVLLIALALSKLI